MKTKARRTLRPALLLALLLLLLILLSAQAAAESCRRALSVCARLIIPSLFPFFVLSSLLNALGLPGLLGRLLAPAAMRLYGISGAGASALPMGLCGGYPAGAAYIAELETSGAVTPREAERLLAFCNNSGPAFLVGAIGCGVFHSVKAGLLLYTCHILAALLTGLIFRDSQSTAEIPPVFLDTTDPAAALSDAIRKSVQAILNVCGFVVFFSVLLSVVENLGVLSWAVGALSRLLGAAPELTRPMLVGFLELGSGVAAMEGLPLSPAALSLAAFLTGWGGLAVYFQTRALLTNCKAKGALHVAGHLFSAGIGATFAYFLGELLL